MTMPPALSPSRCPHSNRIFLIPLSRLLPLLLLLLLSSLSLHSHSAATAVEAAAATASPAAVPTTHHHSSLPTLPPPTLPPLPNDDSGGGGGGGDVGVGVGASAAARLVEHAVHAVLHQPRKLQMNLLSSSDAQPWFPAIAAVESRNRIQLGHLHVDFHSQRIEAAWRNVTLHSDSHIHLTVLPRFLGADTAHLTAHVARALVRLRVVEAEQGGWGVEMEECDMGGGNNSVGGEVHIELERSYLLNLLVNPLHRLLMPRSLIHKTACDLLRNGVERISKRFALELPLASLVPEKFISALRSPNISLITQLRSIVADSNQLSAVASIEWTERGSGNTSTSGANKASDSATPGNGKELTRNGGNSNFLTDVFLPVTNASGTQPTPSSSVLPASGNTSLSAEERAELWVHERTINQLLEQFNWQREWIDERIPMESPQLPQSTSAFLSTLCANCYFVLRVKGSAVPTLTIHSENATLLLRKADQIHMKVVNPGRNVDAVFANFNLALGVQLAPLVENGVFRTQVDLRETNVNMEDGAFPQGWRTFIQDLVKGMILDVIWPGLKREIESLTWSDGVAIPSQCGVEPHSVELRFDSARLGASAVLRLDELAPTQCLQLLKSKLPDPAKLFVIRENKRRRR